MTATLEDAIVLAVEAHRRQTDKAGAAYITHPLRLMLQMATEVEQMVAVLHDVVEDSKMTLEGLRERGFSEQVVDAVDAVTARAGEDYEDFILRAKPNTLARKVKMADLRDNMRMDRIAKLKPKDLQRLARYHRALRVLEEA